MTKPFESSIYIRKVNTRKSHFKGCTLCAQSFEDGYAIGVFHKVDSIMQLLSMFHFTCFKKYLTDFGKFVEMKLPEVWKEKEHILKELNEKYAPEMVVEKL